MSIKSFERTALAAVALNQSVKTGRVFKNHYKLAFVFVFLFLPVSAAQPVESLRPFPKAENLSYKGIRPNNHSQKELNTIVTKFYEYWKIDYLVKTTQVPGDYKVVFNRKNWTVSEAMGYKMLITVLAFSRFYNRVYQYLKTNLATPFSWPAGELGRYLKKHLYFVYIWHILNIE